jgi:glycosyltransferase involved in cell wall biosynthesis
MPSPTSSQTLSEILVSVPRLSKADATSVNLLHEVKVLRNAGWKVSIYARVNKCTDVITITRSEALKLLRKPSVHLIAHFCGFDRDLFRLRRACGGKFIVRYHNVTPPKWFWGYSPRSYAYATLGRLQIAAFVKLGWIDLLISASQFSLDELSGFAGSLAKVKTSVIGVFADLDRFVGGARAKRFLDPDSIQAIVLGRVVPNKGLLDLPEILKRWQNLKSSTPHPTLKIKVVGRVDEDFLEYRDEIIERSQSYGVEHFIDFVGPLSDQELREMFQASDVLLMLSHHEGFCVPVIEAQAAGLPVVALNKGAVAETVGGGAVLVSSSEDRESSEDFVQAIHHLSQDEAYCQQFVKKGFDNIQRVSKDVLAKDFLDKLRPCLTP